MPKPLNIGIIGYGFMGRAHSNAYNKVNKFFELDYHPVMKAACARQEDKIRARIISTARSSSPPPRPARSSCARSRSR